MAEEKPRERTTMALTVGPEEKTALAGAARELELVDEFGRGLSPKGKRFALVLEEEVWEELAGVLSVRSNRSRSAATQRRLDALIERIEDALLVDPEDDEES
jgi:hypothetical protein